MNKQQAIEFLKCKKSEISRHDWSLHPENYRRLDQSEMKTWLDHFDIPEGKFEHNYCFGLPKGWLEGVDEESEDYNDVVEAYEDVYFYLLRLASAEEDIENEISRKDTIAANREYIRNAIA